jgi:hypothetical protein
MNGIGISSTESNIQCKITDLPNQKPGKWDLMIVNEDGALERKHEAFEIKAPLTQPEPVAPPAPPAPPSPGG